MNEAEQTAKKNHAGVIAPPPLLLLAFVVAGFGLDAWLPAPISLDFLQQSWLGGCFIGAGLVIFALSSTEFIKAGTPLPPYKPTTTIVNVGPYRFSRNPIYLSMVLFQAGLGLSFGGLWVLTLLVPFLLIIDYYVIRREERYLEARFSKEYLPYKASVRRWL